MKTYLIWLLCLGLTTLLPAFETKQAAGFSYLQQTGDPDGAFILILHGYGGKAQNLTSLASYDLKGTQPTWIFPSGPLEIPFSKNYVGRAWFALDHSDNIETTILPALSESGKQMIKFIQALNIPASKLFIGGFSQGAILSCEVAFHLPQKIGGLLLLSGTLVNKAEWEKAASSQSGVPFFLSHGINDQVLPLSGAIGLEQLLLHAGLKGKLFEFPGAHAIPPEVMQGAFQFLELHLNQKNQTETKK